MSEPNNLDRFFTGLGVILEDEGDVRRKVAEETQRIIDHEEVLSKYSINRNIYCKIDSIFFPT